MDKQLPPAVTAEQQYLEAIREELRALRLALAPESEASSTAEVVLREPEKRRRGRPRKNRLAAANAK